MNPPQPHHHMQPQQQPPPHYFPPLPPYGGGSRYGDNSSEYGGITGGGESRYNGSNEAYRFGPYCKLRSDREYLVPNAAMWFDRAVENARNKEGQRMLITMFVRCPYRIEDLEEFGQLLEKRASVSKERRFPYTPYTQTPQEDEDMVVVDEDPPTAPTSTSERRSERMEEGELVEEEDEEGKSEEEDHVKTAALELLNVVRFISTIYAYYETEQLKNGTRPTQYVNRIVNARDVQNGHIDIKTPPAILTWFAKEWMAVCGRTTENVMSIYWEQRRRR